MAEIFPDEGLNFILAIFPKNGANTATPYLTLWTAFTASTVGSSSQTMTSYTEPSTGAFARQPVLAGSWGATGAGTGGRTTTATQITFPTATATWGTINGFALASASTTGTCIFACNFDDTTAVTINTNDIIKVTPTIQYNN